MTTSSNPPRPATALITGASSGIGRDLALLMAERGHQLVLLARNNDALQQLASDCQVRFNIRAHVLVKDLADPAAPQQIYDELRQRAIPIDILVNNAGFGTHGPFAQSDLKQELDLIRVNITALVHLTRLFLPDMLQRRSGRILNVASVAALVPGPNMSSYYASKAFVFSHSLALAHELRGSGVTVTALLPGPTRTNFQRRAGMEKANLFRFGIMDSMSVARAGYRAMMAGKRIAIPGWLNRFNVFSTRLAPRWLAAWAAGMLNRGEKQAQRTS